MSSIVPSGSGGLDSASPAGAPGLSGGGAGATNLADVLERVLDKGIVIVGDIRINLLDIELLTIKLRLLIAGVDTARRIGIDWWERDPWLTGEGQTDDRRALDERVGRIERELEAARGSDEPIRAPAREVADE